MTLCVNLTHRTDNPGKKWGCDWPNTYGGTLSRLLLKLFLELLAMGTLLFLADYYQEYIGKYVSHSERVLKIIIGIWSIGLFRLLFRILSRLRRILRSKNRQEAWRKEWPLSSFTSLPNQKLQSGPLLLPFLLFALFLTAVATKQSMVVYFTAFGVFIWQLYSRFEFIGKNLFVAKSLLKVAKAPLQRDGELSLIWTSSKDLSAFQSVEITLRCCRERVKKVSAGQHEARDERNYDGPQEGATKTIRHKRVVWEVRDVLARGPSTNEPVHIAMTFPVYKGGVLAGVDTCVAGDAVDYWELEVTAKETSTSSPWRFVHLTPIAGRALPQAPKTTSKNIDRPLQKSVRKGDCPRCDLPLGANQSCEKCHGQLVLGTEMPHFLPPELADFEQVKNLVRELGNPSFSCPQCAQTMRHTPLKGQSVEVCLGCGSAWFDLDELKKVRGEGL